MKKRLLSMLLTLCMVISVFPTVVFASEAETATTVFEWNQQNGCYLSTTGSNESQSIKVNAGLPEALKTLYNNIYTAETESAKKEAIQAAETAGTISADLADRLERLVHVYTGDELASGVSLQDGSFTATLNGDELVISGTGALPTYTRYNDDFWAPADNSVAMRPWNTEKLGDKAVSSVRFGDGITNIGGYAFWKNTTGYDSKVYITTATFNSTLNVHLPDSLTQIDHSTFLSLEADDIAVPANVAQLSTRLFRKVSRLYVLGDPEISVVASAPRFGTTTNTTVYIAKDSELSKESRITNMDLVEVDAIGACGADAGYSSELVWMVQGDTLTIAAMDGGNGVMADYTDENPAPWNAYASKIKKVVLSAGVANIGTNAFAGLNSLTNVTVPDSVQIDINAESPFGTTLNSISFSFNEGSSFADWLKAHKIDHSADIDELGRKKLTKDKNELFHAYIGTTDIAAKLTDDGVLTIYPTYSATRDTVVPSIGGWHKDNTAYPWFNAVYGKDFSDPAISGSNWNGTTTQLANLKKVVWDKGITDTGAYLFNEAKQWPSTAVEFQIPDSVTIIGAALNGGLRSAGEVCVVPEYVTSLGWGFGGNSAKDVYILNPDLTNIPYDDNAASGKYNRNIVYATTDKFTVHVKAESDAYAALNRDGKTYQNVTTHTDMGACGVAPYSSEVFWLYDESTKTLTIKGSGAMRDYASTYAAPWAYYDVETVTVDAGITQIGAYAFASLKKITKDNVTLDSNVKVADTAFAKPDAQGRLPLPQSDDLYFNEYIGDTTIAAKMSKADGVLTIYPTDKNTVVPSIKGYRGDNTAYPWFEMYKKTYPTKDPKTGLIPEKDWNTFGPYIQYLKKIVWADDITDTGAYLFNMAKTWPSGVVEFRVPDSVTKIGGALNGGSKNAGELCIIPENVTSVGWGFGGNKATDVYILNPNLEDIPYDDNATSGKYNRNIVYATTDKFTVHVKEGSVAYAALNRDGKTYQNVTTHTDLGACGVAPYSSEVIWVYDANSKTLTVLGSGAIRDYDSADAAPWSSRDVETLVVQDGITRIGNNAFAALRNLKTVNVDGSVTEVADTAFATENGTIVDSLNGTKFLTSSNAMKAWLEKHGTSALRTSGICGDYRWRIEGGVLTIEVVVADTDTTDALGKDGKTAVIPDITAENTPDWTAYKSIITKVQLGYGITGIGADAFADMPVLSEVELPSSLKNIGAGAFVNCPNLTKLYLPKQATVADSTFGTASSAEKTMTIQVSPVAPDAQKDLKSQGNTTITVDSSKNLNILLIGNSYFGELSGYLKDIARGLGATDAMIANYYFGSEAGNLNGYVTKINAGKISYNPATDGFSGYKENKIRNDSYNNHPLSKGIEAEDWDYVVIEAWGKNEPAGGNGGGMLSQNQNLKTLKNYIAKYAPQAELSLYHVYSCRSLANRDPVETLTEQWQRYVNGADDGLANIVAHVIPASTLIQNARLTYLNADGGDLLRNPNPTNGSNPDITHLNGEGDYINAIMMYEMLTGKSTAAFDHGSFDNHKEAFYHKLVDVTKAAGMKKLTYAYVEHNGTTTYYDTLAGAAAAAVKGDTLTIMAMPKSDETLRIAAGVTVKTFGSSANHTIVLNGGGAITENGLVAFTGNQVDSEAANDNENILVNYATGAISSYSPSNIAAQWTDHIESTKLGSTTVPGSDMKYSEAPDIQKAMADGYSAIWAAKTETEANAALTAAKANLFTAVQNYVKFLLDKVYNSGKATILGDAAYTLSKEAYTKAFGAIGAATTEAEVLNAYDTALKEQTSKQHPILKKTEAKAATYTETGNHEYYTCETCGKVFKDAAGTQETTVEAETIAKLTRPSSGGYSSGSGRSYAVTAPSTKNGDVTVSPKNASKGDRVTITVTPDKGYELDSLTVMDASGNKLKLTDKGNGKYTFTMPASKVEVNATFVKEVETSPFSDVSTSAYYYEAVKWAQEKGITGGIGNGLFGPNQPCTRAQIVTFLWRAAGSPEPKAMSSFADVSTDAYYAKAVAWAVENGITTGTGDGKFSPDATCTRAQSVTFLFRAIGKLVDSKAEFSDVLTDSYYANAVAWAVENGVTNGIGDGLFGPDNSCTRAQIVTFLFRAYQGK